MAVMNAIVVAQTGDADVLEIQTVPRPEVSTGDALVRIATAGVNFVDVMMRRGSVPADLPFTPGLEAAGVVEAIGDGVSEVKPGDRVMYAGGIGSYAEHCVVPAARLVRLPDDFSLDQGAAMALQGLTAQYLVHEFCHITPGLTVLVHAAAGGVGRLLVQWLKHLGATVIGTVSTEAKAAVAREAGADHVINYLEADFVTETRSLTEGRGADFILDAVGEVTFPGDLEALRVRGGVCVYGMASGPAAPISPTLFMGTSITVSGGSLMNFLRTREELLGRADDLFTALREGWLKLRMEHVYPLGQAAEAHRMLEGRKTTGKVLLKVAD